MKDQCFVISVGGQEVWMASASGKIIKSDFTSKGAASSAIIVENKRQKKRAGLAVK